MTLYDLYLDNQVEGYLVFKTLAKQKVIEMTDYQYHRKLKISKEDLQPKGSCLSFPLQNNFEDVIHILESHTGDSKIMNPTFHTSVRRPVEMFHLYTRIPMILFGTTQTNQSFIMRDNIRNSQTIILEIHRLYWIFIFKMVNLIIIWITKFMNSKKRIYFLNTIKILI